ncbi:MAG: hypothetical protein ACYDCQ_01060 [Dehalococcoidia bacterium]
MRVIDRFRMARGATARQAEGREADPLAVSESRAHTLVLWLLTAWTVLCALVMLVAQGDFSSMLAAGMPHDPAAQRLFGVQLLVLAPVYGYAAARPRNRGFHVWLPLAAQALTALAILYDIIAGNRGFGPAWPALTVALLFTLLLAAFQLAGEPAFQPHRELTALHRFEGDAGANEDSRTQRLHRASDPTDAEPPVNDRLPVEARESSKNDDPVLGA